MTKQINKTIFPLIKIIKSILGSDEFPMLFSQIAKTTSELFPQYVSGVISKKENNFFINSVSNAKEWIHFPIKLIKHPANLTTDCFFKKCELEIPNVGTHKLLFFPLETAQNPHIEAWFFIDEKFMPENQKDNIFLFVEILREATQKIIKIEKIKELTIIDDVTGLFNTRHLFSILEQTIIQSERYHSEFSLIFFDIDHFKSVNDTYGHLIGDKVLKTVVQVVSDTLRDEDIICRYGGEEFLLIMDAHEKAAKHVCERIRKKVEETIIDTETMGKMSVTISLGTATFHKKLNNIKEFIAEADKYLYAAKENGRNRVVNKEIYKKIETEKN